MWGKRGVDEGSLSLWREAESERELKLDFGRRCTIEGGPRVGVMMI